jgi:transglutaminase superfamily protein
MFLKCIEKYVLYFAVSLIILVCITGCFSRNIKLDVIKNGSDILLKCEDNKPEGIRISNIGKCQVRGIKLIRQGHFDYTGADIILKQILKKDFSKKEKALAIFNLVGKKHGYSPNIPPDEKEPHDPVKYFCVYGYGICDDHAKVLYNLSKKAGLKARLHALSGHVVTEIYYNERWHLFDADACKYYTMPGKNKILSVQEIADNPDIVIDQDGKELKKWLKKVYSTTADNKAYENYPVRLGHKAIFNLSENESVTFFKKGKYGFYGDLQKEKKPPRYSNAVFTKKISQPLKNIKNSSQKNNIRIDFSSPFIGVRGDIRIHSKGKQKLEITANGKKITNRNILKIENGIYEYRVKIEKEFHGKYKCSLKITSPDIKKLYKLESIKFKWITQCAPQFCPYLDKGKNILSVYYQENPEHKQQLQCFPVYKTEEK